MSRLEGAVHRPTNATWPAALTIGASKLRQVAFSGIREDGAVDETSAPLSAKIQLPAASKGVRKNAVWLIVNPAAFQAQACTRYSVPEVSGCTCSCAIVSSAESS